MLVVRMCLAQRLRSSQKASGALRDPFKVSGAGACALSGGMGVCPWHPPGSYTHRVVPYTCSDRYVSLSWPLPYGHDEDVYAVW